MDKEENQKLEQCKEEYSLRIVIPKEDKEDLGVFTEYSEIEF